MKDPAIREKLRKETETANTLFANTQLAVGGPPQKLVVQGVDPAARTCRSTSGSPSGQIAEEEGKHYIDVMLDLSLDDRPQDRVPRRGPRLQRRPHGRRLQRVALHHPRRVRRRRPHQVLHRWRLDDGLPGLDGPGREEDHARGGALPHVGAGRPCRRLPRSWRPARRRPGRRDRLRHGRAGHRSRRGSARPSTTCPAASGAGSSGPTATATSSSTAWRRSPTASAPAPRPASCSATARAESESSSSLALGAVWTAPGASRVSPAAPRRRSARAGR